MKGNGYGFGRAGLAVAAATLSPILAVGTVHELVGLPDESTRSCSPRRWHRPDTTEPVLTVGRQRPHRCAARLGRPGDRQARVATMHRYGGDVELVARSPTRRPPHGRRAIHPPLAGTDDEHRRADRPAPARHRPDRSTSGSATSPPATYERLPDSHQYKLRLGTLPLARGSANRCSSRPTCSTREPIEAGERRRLPTSNRRADGTLVMIGAGTANGVAALPTAAARSITIATASSCSNRRTCTRRWRSSRSASLSERSAAGSTCSAR